MQLEQPLERRRRTENREFKPPNNRHHEWTADRITLGLLTWSREMISSLVLLTMEMSSTAKAGYEMMARTPASTSLEMEARVLDVVSQSVDHRPRSSFRSEKVEVVQSLQSRLQDKHRRHDSLVHHPGIVVQLYAGVAPASHGDKCDVQLTFRKDRVQNNTKLAKSST
ncbi:hypothetical protein F7725_004841, partial [Dissostichus mawsoni]